MRHTKPDGESSWEVVILAALLGVTLAALLVSAFEL